MNEKRSSKEYRATARILPETKKRLQEITRKHPRVSESDIINLGLDLVLPKIEAGKFNPLKAA